MPLRLPSGVKPVPRMMVAVCRAELLRFLALCKSVSPVLALQGFASLVLAPQKLAVLVFR